MSDKEAPKLLGHAISCIDTIRTTKDAGFKVTFEFGSDSIDLVNALMRQKGIFNNIHITIVTNDA